MKAWGADGCRAGWFFFGLGDGEPAFGVGSDLAELLGRAGSQSPIFIDIPIGLRDSGDRERVCDLEARKLLSPTRGSSVFPAPSRPAVYARDYAEAQRLNQEALGKRLSRQSWAIAPKIREVDTILRAKPETRNRIRELHPEVCFWGLTGRPMQHSKKTRVGYYDRLRALEKHFSESTELVTAAFVEHGGFDTGRDDIVDALVAALCALHASDCATLPSDPERDAAGLPMEIVFWRPKAS